MKFGNLSWLLGGALTCIVLVWAWQRYDARQRAALERFIAVRLRSQLTQSVSILARQAQRILFAGAVALLFTALAGPLAGYRWEEIHHRGNEVVFVIDTSRSMLTPDVKPNRLVRAKLAIDDLVRQMDGDAVGIVAFAGSAFLVCPMTLDYGAFHESLTAVDTHSIPHGGTNISSGIREAAMALGRRPGGEKIVILITDGEELQGSALAEAQAANRQFGLKIFTVGVGTTAGDLIPIPAEQGGGFVKDENGAVVKSRLDEAALKAIATAGGGRYAPLGAQEEGLEDITHAILGAASKHDLAYRQQRVYIERFQWPLAASLILLVASLLMGTRRWISPTAAPGVVVAASLGTMLLILMVCPPPAAADPKQDANPPVADYNSGAAAYRAGQFSQATAAFDQSIKRAPSSNRQRLADQEDAYYNLGNALYRAGQAVEKSASPDALKKWKEAVKAYDTALQLSADDADAKYNRDLVQRKIDALENPPPNPQQKPQQNPQQNAGQPPPGQPPPGQRPPGQPPSQKEAPPQPSNPPPPTGQPPPENPPEAEPPPEGSRAPGQMSRAEAQQLLDSAKGDERHGPAVPSALNNLTRDPPEKPFKDW